MTNGSLMKVESNAECAPWSILHYFWSALSDNWSQTNFRSFWECSPWSILQYFWSALSDNWSQTNFRSFWECSPWSILQYFWSALSDNWSQTNFRSFWEWLFYTGFTVLTFFYVSLRECIQELRFNFIYYQTSQLLAGNTKTNKWQVTEFMGESWIFNP